MDSKKWYKRISTCVWWFVILLPVLIALIFFIAYHFDIDINISSDLVSYHNDSSGDFINILNSILLQFKNFTPRFFK